VPLTQLWRRQHFINTVLWRQCGLYVYVLKGRLTRTTRTDRDAAPGPVSHQAEVARLGLNLNLRTLMGRPAPGRASVGSFCLAEAEE
jgi:hypothetical protein